MEALWNLIEKLAGQGGAGLVFAVLLVVLAVAALAIRTLYADNQAQHRASLIDAKEFARGLAAGIATLDAVKELVLFRRDKR